MSFFRRAGAAIARIIQSTADPLAETDRVLVYGKDAAGVTQLFARASDGAISQLTPAASVTPSVAIVRVGDAPSVNLSTLGTIDWFVQNTVQNAPRTLTTNRFAKARGGYIFVSFNGNSAGQTTDTALMVATTRSSNATDSIEGVAVSQTTSWGISTPNALANIFGIMFRVPSSDEERVLRVYCANTLNLARLTCRLDDAAFTTASIDSDNNGTILTHEYKVTFKGGRNLDVLWRPVSKYAGTHQLAFAGASLGFV